MSSFSAALQKLHVRRKSTSSSNGKGSPVNSPARGSTSRNSVDGSPTSPTTRSGHVGASGDGGYETGGSGRVSTASLNKDLPSPPSARGGDGGPPPLASSSLPRSQAQFSLPTIPPSPMDEHGAVNSEMGAGGALACSSPPRLPSIRPLSGFGETDQGHDIKTTGWTEWTEAADIQPMEVSHELTPPPSLFPVSIPSFPYDEDGARCAFDLPEGFKPIPQVTTQQQQTVRTERHGVNVAPVNPAFVADHRYSIGIPNRQRRSPSASGTDDAVHRAHIRKHLDLLEPRIFYVKPRGRPMRTPSLTRRTNASSTGSKGTKILPLKAGRAVPYEQAERELTRQRESLLEDIANSGRYPRGDASTALETARDGKIEIDPKKKLVFDSIGWTDRLGILDTVDMHTQYLEPVVQVSREERGTGPAVRCWANLTPS